MMDFEFGQDRLGQPQPLQALKLGGSIETSLQACFVAEQMIELRRQRNVLLKHFQTSAAQIASPRVLSYIAQVA